MKKALVATVIIVVFALYIFTHGRASPSVPAASPPTQSGASAASTPTTSTSVGTAPAGSVYKNGTFSGGTYDAQWGVVQVQAVVQNGKLTNVTFLQYPHDRSRSVEINSYAVPQLTTEAIQAQSAQVDVVSGATDTSFAFMQSLGDALSQAQA